MTVKSYGRAFFILPGKEMTAMPDTNVRDITEKLEQGIKDLFESDKYAEYLKTMSRFHSYSTRNTLLIHLQDPTARRVAGFLSYL